ncbi:MAG: molybdenum cofactor guanylyltransferase [Chloroflexi bacterium]|nr:molybdenum cofactor guanylyltransferase [Chloroflexota bacterium]
MSCIVLAGGKGIRLKRDKVLENIGNINLLQRVVSCLSFYNSEIIIVTASKQSLPLSVDYPKLRVKADIYPGKGPLGGIYTGLMTSNHFYNLVVASDMPFLNRELLSYMMKLSVGFDLVVPRMGALVEPLHAVYSKNCVAPIENMLKQGTLQIHLLFPLVKVKYIDTEEIDKFDPEHLSFFNINTEADLKRARELLREKSDDKCRAGFRENN